MNLETVFLPKPPRVQRLQDSSGDACNMLIMLIIAQLLYCSHKAWHFHLLFDNA